MNSLQRWICISLVLLCVPVLSFGAAHEKSDDEAAERGSYLTVKIITLGQGDPLYVWFGHIALIVEDRLTEKSIMFNYGVFDFHQKDFYKNFILGRLYFKVMASYTEQQIVYAKDSQRNISIITLNLSPKQRYTIYSYLMNNIKPENSIYLYHHYNDNCSTRIRDVIDTAVDGQLKEWATQIPSAYTYREHIRRYTENHFFMDFVLNFLQSDIIDQKISLWEEMFLPDRLEMALRDFSYINEQGKEVPFVEKYEQIASFDKRQPIPDLWEPHWPMGLAIGLLIGLIGVLLHRSLWKDPNLNGNKTVRIFAGIYQTITGLSGGILGSILFFMIYFTNHDVTFGNTNLLLLNPLTLFIGIFGIALIAGNKKALRYNDILWRIMAITGLTLLFLKIFSIIDQQNQLSISIILPISVCMGFGSLCIRKWDRSHKERKQ